MINWLGMTIPLVQAPMAGVSTPALAAAVPNAGGLGSIGVGATDANGARDMIGEVRAMVRNDREQLRPSRLGRARETAKAFPLGW